MSGGEGLLKVLAGRSIGSSSLLPLLSTVSDEFQGTAEPLVAGDLGLGDSWKLIEDGGRQVATLRFHRGHTP
jgi:hypothetical protein